MANTSAWAQDCQAQVADVVDQLEVEVVPLSAVQRARTLELVARVCASGNAMTEPAPEVMPQDEESTRVLGIDFHKADADSKGSQRLKKKR